MLTTNFHVARPAPSRMGGRREPLSNLTLPIRFSSAKNPAHQCTAKWRGARRECARCWRRRTGETASLCRVALHAPGRILVWGTGGQQGLGAHCRERIHGRPARPATAPKRASPALTPAALRAAPRASTRERPLRAPSHESGVESLRAFSAPRLENPSGFPYRPATERTRKAAIARTRIL